MAEYTIGIDPGQSIDPTAFAVVRRVDGGTKPIFQCGHLERLPLNTPYPGVVRRAQHLRYDFPGAELVLDLTGVGRPVYDLFQLEGLRPVRVTITAGHEEIVDDRGGHHVPKLVLISSVQALLHDSRLLIQKNLPEAPALRAELEDFRATVTDSGRWTFGARSGAHDDLVLALALAVWRANRKNPTNIDPSFLAKVMQMGPARPVLGAVGYGELNRGEGDLMRL
jgi:hypothetical protein